MLADLHPVGGKARPVPLGGARNRSGGAWGLHPGKERAGRSTSATTLSRRGTEGIGLRLIK